jgi:hypothetical protein
LYFGFKEVGPLRVIGRKVDRFIQVSHDYAPVSIPQITGQPEAMARWARSVAISEKCRCSMVKSSWGLRTESVWLACCANMRSVPLFSGNRPISPHRLQRNDFSDQNHADADQERLPIRTRPPGRTSPRYVHHSLPPSPTVCVPTGRFRIGRLR